MLPGPDRAAQLTTRLVLEDRALFIGPLPNPVPHAHHVLQVAVPLTGALRVETCAGELVTDEGVLIAADTLHAVGAQCLVAHFYLDPESDSGSRLGHWLGEAPARALPHSYAGRMRSFLRRAVREGAAPEAMRCLLDRLLDELLRLAPAEAPRLDARVARILDRLQRDPGEEASLAMLASAVALSPDRLRHLFRDQVGISLRSYRRFLRVVRALQALQRGESVTQAAAASGFADAAHLTRTFRIAFTEPPREVVRGSRFVQAPLRSRS